MQPRGDEPRVVFRHRKGKKDGKQETKPDKESDMEKVKANAALWEFRLHVSDRALVQYREECHKLARAHGELSDQLYRQERDTIDITRYLKGQNVDKEEKVRCKSPRVFLIE